VTTKGYPTTVAHDWKTAAICPLLAALTWAVFGQTLGREFVNSDDNKATSGSDVDSASGAIIRGKHSQPGNIHDTRGTASAFIGHVIHHFQTR
jgi:hypothetical protein